jgi:hypothetical protein
MNNLASSPKKLGRPCNGIPTKTVRVREQFAVSGLSNELVFLRDYIHDWQYRSSQAEHSDTSPRWEKLNEFLSEIEELIPIILSAK